MKHLVVALTLLAVTPLLSSSVAFGCTKDWTGFTCSGECPKSTPTCQTSIGISGVKCECVKKPKNQSSAADGGVEEGEPDPIIAALLDLSTEE